MLIILQKWFYHKLNVILKFLYPQNISLWFELVFVLRLRIVLNGCVLDVINVSHRHFSVDVMLLYVE